MGASGSWICLSTFPECGGVCAANATVVVPLTITKSGGTAQPGSVSLPTRGNVSNTFGGRMQELLMSITTRTLEDTGSRSTSFRSQT